MNENAGIIDKGSKYPYQYRYPHHAVTTDCVIFGFDGTNLNVLLVERGLEPFKGCWAFPGGFLRPDETAEQCAMRELKEETGLSTAYMKQFHIFSAVDRDPRERVLTVAFNALVQLSAVQGGDDAASAKWFPISEVPQLAFDHAEILQMALASMRHQIHFEPIGFELLPRKFTMTSLQKLYEAILDVKFDRRNFYNKIKKLGIIDLAEKGSRTDGYLYSFNEKNYTEMKNKGFRLEF